MTAAFVFGLIAFAAVIANIAVRDHRRAVTARRELFDECQGVLDEERWSAGDDGFPRIEGRAGGRFAKATLIPDTMVIRRLPQLWLSVTLLVTRAGSPSLSLIARHTGNEFYAGAPDLPMRIDPPQGLPLDVYIRGDGHGAQMLCNGLTTELVDLFADPRVKEITLTPKGVRIVRQAAEGQRGEHLLLRQVVFGGVKVERAMLVTTLGDAERLIAARDALMQERAA